MKNITFRTYVRELIEDFPRYAMLASREWGWIGFRIAFKAYVLRSGWRAIESPIGGINTHSELLNFLDNFCANELRCREVEAYLKNKDSALVIDVGVNVGVSVRWWLTRSPTLQVIGVDMVSEALEFTSRRVASLGFSDRLTMIESAVGDHVGVVRFQTLDLLDGTTSLLSETGAISREVPINTLDSLLAISNNVEIDLLKLDIEGYAGLALRGAIETLKKARYVCIETHNEEETELCAQVLTGNGFTLFKTRGRHMWWRR